MDVLAVERTGAFHGVYHVLHGALSPIDGIYPEKLKIAERQHAAITGWMIRHSSPPATNS